MTIPTDSRRRKSAWRGIYLKFDIYYHKNA
jgi:hypothetical protein